MKIRRYKGTNRETLYRQIHKEMGPHAVVVAPETSGGIGWNRKIELIAIVDDSGGAPAVNEESTSASPQQGDSSDFSRLSRQQMRQMQSLQSTMQDIRRQMGQLQSGVAQNALDREDGPAHCAHWDPRFRDWAKAENPVLLTGKPMPGFRALSQWFPVSDPFSFRNEAGGPHVIVLVGPTGSGKTTTLAKLAAICSHRHKLRVGLITTDTYRVAAVDQIREYATLLGIELRVVFAASEGARAIADMSDLDVIFVDTPGRSPGDEMGLAMSRRILGGMGKTTVFLTIPATVSPATLPHILEGFGGFDPDYLVITKVDEVKHPALLTSLPFESSLKMAFVTNGQRVPEDIFAADGARFASMLLPSPDEAVVPSEPLPPRIGLPVRAGAGGVVRDSAVRVGMRKREVAVAGV